MPIPNHRPKRVRAHAASPVSGTLVMLPRLGRPDLHEIRAAIAKGAYDSDCVLDFVTQRLLLRLEAATDRLTRLRSRARPPAQAAVREYQKRRQ